MELTDTHAHLYLEQFDKDMPETIKRAVDANVSKILLPNIDKTTIDPLHQLVNENPQLFIPMMGLHPTSVKEDWEDQLKIIYNELINGDYIAVGEIGLDLHWDKSTLSIQQQAFEQQLEWSKDLNLPVSMHSRSALAEVGASIKKVGEKSLYGVFHSFGGNLDELKAIMEMENFYIGINGVVTFKNAGLKEIIHHCPIERIVIETDAPYLAPVPHRGKRNESSFLREIVKTLSETHQLTESKISDITTNNAYNLFNIKRFAS